MGSQTAEPGLDASFRWLAPWVWSLPLQQDHDLRRGRHRSLGRLNWNGGGHGDCGPRRIYSLSLLKKNGAITRGHRHPAPVEPDAGHALVVDACLKGLQCVAEAELPGCWRVHLESCANFGASSLNDSVDLGGGSWHCQLRKLELEDLGVLGLHARGLDQAQDLRGLHAVQERELVVPLGVPMEQLAVAARSEADGV